MSEEDDLAKTIERLRAEAAAAAERADIDRAGEAVVREVEQNEAAVLAQRRLDRVQPLVDRTERMIESIGQGLPLWSGVGTGQDPAVLRHIMIRWEGSPRRQIGLEFHSGGEIRVWRYTTVDGLQLSSPDESRRIDAASENAEAELEKAIRWIWDSNAPGMP